MSPRSGEASKSKAQAAWPSLAAFGAFNARTHPCIVVLALRLQRLCHAVFVLAEALATASVGVTNVRSDNWTAHHNWDAGVLCRLTHVAQPNFSNMALPNALLTGGAGPLPGRTFMAAIQAVCRQVTATRLQVREQADDHGLRGYGGLAGAVENAGRKRNRNVGRAD